MNSYQTSPDESPSRNASRRGAGLRGLILLLSVCLFCSLFAGGMFLTYEPDPSTTLEIFCTHLINHQLHQAYLQFIKDAQSQYPEQAFTQFYTRHTVTSCHYSDYASHDSGFGGARLDLVTSPSGKLTFKLGLRADGYGTLWDGFQDRWKIQRMCTPPPHQEGICGSY